MTTLIGYSATRSTAGFYQRPGTVLRLTGTQRRSLARKVIARSLEFASTNIGVDSVLLNDTGEVVGMALVIQCDDEILVIADADKAWLKQIYDLAALEDVTVEATDLGAVAVEGPLSWRVIGSVLADIAMENVLLNEAVSTSVNGSPVLLVRSGTTAEFGYILIGDVDVVTSEIEQAAAEFGGEPVSMEALRRMHIETNYPVLPAQVRGANLLEAGLGWFATIDRQDDFVGSSIRDLTAPERRIVAAWCDGEFPAEGTEVLLDGVVVGKVQVAAGILDGRSIGLLLLNDPCGVPGLSLIAGGSTLETTSRPALTPKSWNIQIGVA